MHSGNDLKVGSIADHIKVWNGLVLEKYAEKVYANDPVEGKGR